MVAPEEVFLGFACASGRDSGCKDSHMPELQDR